jgi:hypothetical protein
MTDSDDFLLYSLIQQINTFNLTNITDINPSDIKFDPHEEYCIYYLGHLIANFMISNDIIDSDTILQSYKSCYPNCNIDDTKKIIFIKGIISLFQNEIKNNLDKSKMVVLNEILSNIEFTE